MKYILPVLIAAVFICVYLYGPEQQQATSSQTLSIHEASPNSQTLPSEPTRPASLPMQTQTEDSADQTQSTTDTEEAGELEPESAQSEPVEDDNPLNFNLDQSTHFLILGNAEAEKGQMNFKSELLPSNEVQLSIKLHQEDSDQVELKAYFDLANFTMELDGGNSILNKEHKKLLKESGEALQSAIWEQYAEYDIPEHALMLTQMLAYWSVSPEGFVHEKRVIVSQ